MTRSDSYRVESFSPGHRPGARATGWLTSAVRRARIAGLVFVLFGVFSALTGVYPASAGEDGLTWAVTQASGDVRHRTGGFFSTEWQKLRVGDVVGAAAEIRTGRNSRVVLRHRKTTITATSESRLALPGSSAFSGAYRVLQNLGTLLYNIKERANGMAAFEVETPYLVALVKGTVFTVNASAEEASVELSEGVVKVQPTGGGTGATLAAGQTARVTRASGADVIVGGRGADRRSSVKPRAPTRLAMANTERTGPAAGGGNATTRKDPGTGRASTGTESLAKKARVLAARQVAALSAVNRGDSGGDSGGGGADDARDEGRVAGERADGGDPGGDNPGGTGDGGQAPGASPEGGNPGGGGTGVGTDVGGSVGGGDPGGGQMARSDQSQDTARGANTGRGEAKLFKMATDSSATFWSVPSIGMETAEGWMASIWEGISEGMETWVGAVWLLAIWAVLWVAISMLKITLTKTKKRPPENRAAMARRRIHQPA